jgi:enterochelin esterase-like enzyme
VRKDRQGPRGAVHTIAIESEALRGNLLGDPTTRDVAVYVPAGSDGAGLPLLVDLVGFTGSGFSHVAWRNFGENVPERLDRLIASGAMPPVCVAFPDCFTRLGGNQYIDSVAMGRWEHFLCVEMLHAIEGRFRCGGAGRRGVFGKSSGGYGALVHAMRHADVWSAAASHSGDVGFEMTYAADFPRTLRALAKKGGIQAFIAAFEATEKPSDDDIHVIMTLAMAASYDPDPSSYLGVTMPCDLHTCERDLTRWARWMAWDPLTLVEHHADALRSLKLLYIDCGDVDQYNLVYGARVLHRRLSELDVRHHYEEFPDDHTKVDYRMDVSLPLLARALTA